MAPNKWQNHLKVTQAIKSKKGNSYQNAKPKQNILICTYKKELYLYFFRQHKEMHGRNCKAL